MYVYVQVFSNEVYDINHDEQFTEIRSYTKCIITSLICLFFKHIFPSGQVPPCLQTHIIGNFIQSGISWVFIFFQYKPYSETKICISTNLHQGILSGIIQYSNIYTVVACGYVYICRGYIILHCSLFFYKFEGFEAPLPLCDLIYTLYIAKHAFNLLSHGVPGLSSNQMLILEIPFVLHICRKPSEQLWSFKIVETYS